MEKWKEIFKKKVEHVSVKWDYEGDPSKERALLKWIHRSKASYFENLTEFLPLQVVYPLKINILALGNLSLFRHPENLFLLFTSGKSPTLNTPLG